MQGMETSSNLRVTHIRLEEVLAPLRYLIGCEQENYLTRNKNTPRVSPQVVITVHVIQDDERQRE